MMKLLLIPVALLVSRITAQDTCSLCSGGSQDFNASKPIFGSDLVDRNVTSCGDLARIASLTNSSSDDCELFDAHAGWCECVGVTPTCTLCQDGSPPADPDIVVPFHNLTCEAFSYLISVGASNVDCTRSQTFGSLCGCIVNSTEMCTLCPNGEPVPNPNSTIPFLGSCASIESITSALPPSELCSELQVAGILNCGCSQSNETNGNCTVCEAGSSFPDPDAIAFIVEGIYVTCETTDFFLTALNEDKCAVAAYLAAQVCGCTPAVAFPLTCSLCEDGSIPPKLFEEVVSDSTCLDLAADFAFEVAGSQNCTAIQATGGVYCGCNNTLASQNAATCRICGKDKLLPDPVAEAGKDGSCGDIEISANLGVISCADAQAYASDCCQSNVAIPSGPPASTDSPAGGLPTTSLATILPGEQPTSPPSESPSGSIALPSMLSTLVTMILIWLGLT